MNRSAGSRSPELHATRAQSPEAFMAANGRTVVPAAVRREALWDHAANRDVQLRKVVLAASLVDASVVVSAELLPDGDVVETLTSDPADLAALAGLADVRIDVAGPRHRSVGGWEALERHALSGP